MERATVRNKVSLKDVQRAYEKTKIIGLKKLLAKMAEYDMGYVPVAEYETAAQYNECSCGAKIKVEESRCQRCVEGEEQKKRQLEAIQARRIQCRNFVKSSTLKLPAP